MDGAEEESEVNIIILGVEMDMVEEIMVSVYCLAYNHEKYIKDCLEGFVKQKTNFKYEVIVHDDASTDNTANIIKEYADKYPDIIKPILQKENQYSQGVEIVDKFIGPLLKGKYVAICEGDDYWCDEHKLQRQVEILENHPEYIACVHQTKTANSSTGEVGLYSKLRKSGVIEIEKMLRDRGPVYHTSSLCYHKEALEEKPDFCYIVKGIGDYPKEFALALQGDIYYLNKVMSVYRQFTESSWSLKVKNDILEKEKYYQEIIALLKAVNSYSKYKYKDLLDKTILDFKYQMWKLNPQISVLKDEDFSKLSLRKKIKIIMRSILKKN